MSNIKSQVCLWPVDKTDCGIQAVDRVNLTKSHRIPVCEKHKAEHNRNMAERRVSSK